MTSRLHAQSPYLTGRVEIGLKEGQLSSDLCLSQLPAGDTLRFLLHHGLNIRTVTDSAGRMLAFDGPMRLVGDGLLYVVRDSATGPRTLCVSSSGRYAVFDKLDAASDYKGEIAFTGRTLRAAEQTKWYPVLYDSAAGRMTQDVSYSITVHCPECSALYLNGSAPIAASDERFSSAKPRPLLLFAGDFPFREVEGTWFLGGELPDTAAAQMGATIARIEGYEARLVDLPFRDSLVLIEHSALNQATGRGGWGFTTWPTIAVAGAPLGELARGLARPDSSSAWVWSFLSHELGHYYFGTVLQPRGPWRWFYTESTAEYLSLLATRHFQGDAAFRRVLQRYWRVIDRMPRPIPLDSINREDQIDESYRYAYAPLLLVALGNRIGAERMTQLLHAALTAPASRMRDYAFLRASALAAGVSEDAWGAFERDCITPSPGASCLPSLPALADSVATHEAR